jgi:hypothetical protein
MRRGPERIQDSRKILAACARNVRGNYYNALSDTTLAVYGSVDKKTQRAAWTVGDRKEPAYEAGFANLTQPAKFGIWRYPVPRRAGGSTARRP